MPGGRSALRASATWRDVVVVPVTGSTNADLVRLAREGVPAPTALAAREQTGGRGRLDRSWASPAGTSLSLSVLWRPVVPQQRWTWVPAVVGLAVVDAVGAVGAGAALKWPNDVVVPTAPGVAAVGGPDTGPGALGGLAKLAGVLVEVVSTPAGPAVVAGVGLNLGQERAGLPVRTATSLRLLLGDRAPGFDEALALLLDAVASRFRQWETDHAGLRADYLAVCTTLGRLVTVSGRHGPATVRGRAVDLGDDASLVLQDGPDRHVVAAGDVEHVR